MGVKVNPNLVYLVGVFLMVLLGAAFFSHSPHHCLPGKDPRTLHGHRPGADHALFFASNSIYPISIMPTWLQVIAKVNPLSYEVDALRAMMLLAGGTSTFGLGVDFAVLISPPVF